MNDKFQSMNGNMHCHHQKPKISCRPTFVFFLVVLGIGRSSLALAQISVPDIACVRDATLIQGHLPKERQIKIDLPDSVAKSLEVYNYSSGFMLGPRGWNCRLHDQEGYFILSIRPSDKRDRTYGITYVFVYGKWGSYKEGNIYSYANSYFPNEIKREISEGFVPSTDNAAPLYKFDMLKNMPPLYSVIPDNKDISGVAVAYITPAYQLGVGTNILFGLGESEGLPSKRTSSARIQGFIKLNLSLKVESGDLFAISLPENLSGLVNQIQSYAEIVNMTPLWTDMINKEGVLKWKN